jgi:hypothetical protein
MMVERVEITEKIGKIWTEEGWNGMEWNGWRAERWARRSSALIGCARRYRVLYDCQMTQSPPTHFITFEAEDPDDDR